MTINPTKVTSEEITQYRQKFADKPEALDALDLIVENDGNLVESAGLLALESGIEISRGIPNILDDLALKYRGIICNEAFDDLMAGLLSAAVVTFAASGQIPVAVATPVVIYVARIGVDKFCKSSEEESRNP